MLSVISGVVVFGAGGAGLWYFKPNDDVAHPLATAPLLESVVPIGIVSALAIGVSLIVAGVVT